MLILFKLYIINISYYNISNITLEMTDYVSNKHILQHHEIWVTDDMLINITTVYK